MHWPKRLTGSSIHIGQEGPREIWREACGMVISATTLESRTILAHCSVAPPRGPRAGEPCVSMIADPLALLLTSRLRVAVV